MYTISPDVGLVIACEGALSQYRNPLHLEGVNTKVTTLPRRHAGDAQVVLSHTILATLGSSQKVKLEMAK